MKDKMLEKQTQADLLLIMCLCTCASGIFRQQETTGQA